MQIELKDGDVFNCISDSDLAALADWAEKQKYAVPHPDMHRPFSLIREGADTLLRRRARSRGETISKKEKEK